MDGYTLIALALGFWGVLELARYLGERYRQYARVTRSLAAASVPVQRRSVSQDGRLGDAARVPRLRTSARPGRVLRWIE